MSVTDSARRLVARPGGHRVVSLYLDLDPDEFALPPARATQITSLTDRAERMVESDPSFDHAERLALRADVRRVRRYLLSDEPPLRGARALAVFSSIRDDLFEVIPMSRGVAPQVVIDRTAHVAPLLSTTPDARWCVALVSRSDARILTGTAERLRERFRAEDEVHGQHQQGGWSQARYQRSVDEDVDGHLRTVADALLRLWQRGAFDQLVVGGPVEAVSRFERFLPGEVRPRLVQARAAVDVSTAGEEEIAGAVSGVVEEAQRERERTALDRLAAGLGSGGRAAGGLDQVLEALAERRVQRLLLAPDWEAAGGRCPACGLLRPQRSGTCPADGSPLEAVASLREAVVGAALLQDAEVILVTRYPDLGPHRGIAALLRF